jgi:hypothetical protein
MSDVPKKKWASKNLNSLFQMKLQSQRTQTPHRRTSALGMLISAAALVLSLVGCGSSATDRERERVEKMQRDEFKAMEESRKNSFMDKGLPPMAWGDKLWPEPEKKEADKANATQGLKKTPSAQNSAVSKAHPEDGAASSAKPAIEKASK